MDQYDDSEFPPLRLVGGIDFEKKKLGIPVRNRGVMFDRILPGQHPQENTRQVEAAFVEEWAEQNKEPLLERLLCTGKNDPRREFVPQTPREWEIAHLVAATVIQWLPTSVGCSFLHRGFKRGGGELQYRLPDWKTFSRS